MNKIRNYKLFFTNKLSLYFRFYIYIHKPNTYTVFWSNLKNGKYNIYFPLNVDGKYTQELSFIFVFTFGRSLLFFFLKKKKIFKSKE